MSLPVGTVTFLMTDVEGSTRLWEAGEEAMRSALAIHDGLLGETAQRFDGYLIKERGEGDSLFVVFARAPHALAAAVEAQRRLLAQRWPTETPLRVRMAVHTGEAEVRSGDYYGSAVNRCARLRNIAHGGQVVLSASATELVRDALPPDTELIDLGLHRLKDLTRPERVAQAGHPELDREFPALRSMERVLHNLPIQLSSFLGREAEMNAVRDLLAAHRLVSLTGLGGTGKSRLALQVAAELVDEFTGGVWLVALESVDDPARVWSVLAEAINEPVMPGSEVADALFAALRGKRVLLLLDGCEHLVAACAEVAVSILERCPEVRILSTTREAFGVPGEVTMVVGPLPTPPPAPARLDVLTQYDAFRLFVDRAATARPGFAVDDETGAAVAQICHTVDGIPLAIELAAARMRTLSPAQISDRLGDAFELLTGGARTALPRHQTLRATLDWSYDALGDRERTLFRRLAVLPAGCDLVGAEAVCSSDDLPRTTVLQTLTNLLDRSLLHTEAASRFRMLDTVRRYAHEKLGEAGEVDLTMRRLLDHLHEAFGGVPPKRGSPRGLPDALEAEVANLRAALDHGLAAGRVRAAELVAWLSAWWWTDLDRVREARVWVGRALSLDCPLWLHCDLLLNGGTLDRLSREYTQAGRHLDEAAAMATSIGDDARLADAMVRRGDLLWAQGRIDSAVETLEAAVSIARSLDDRSATQPAISQLAYVHTDPARALALYEELIEATPHDHFDRAVYLFQASRRARELQQETVARSYVEEVRALADAASGRERVQLLTMLGTGADGSETIQYYEQAVELSAVQGDPYPFPAFQNLISTLLEQDQGRARELLERQVAHLRRERPERELLVPLLSLARIKAHTGDVDGCRQLLDEASAIARNEDDVDAMSEADSILGDAMLVAGDARSAVLRYRRCLALFEASGQLRQVAWWNAMIAIAALEYDTDLAADHLGRVLLSETTLEGIGRGILVACARLAHARGRSDDSAALFVAADPVTPLPSHLVLAERSRSLTHAALVRDLGEETLARLRAAPMPFDDALTLALSVCRT